MLDVYITINYWSIRVETTENDIIRYGRPSRNKCNEKIEDTKRVIRSRKSTDRQYTGQRKKDKRTDTDLLFFYLRLTDYPIDIFNFFFLQSTMQKTRVTGSQHKKSGGGLYKVKNMSPNHESAT